MNASQTAILCISMLTLGGCAYKGASIPNASLPMASADYTVLGATTADDCAAYIFAIDIEHLLVANTASVSASSGGSPLGAILAMVGGGGGAEESRALYKALEKIPEASHLIDIRSESTTTGLAPMGRPFFAQRCATVHARGVKLGAGPVPNAN